MFVLNTPRRLEDLSLFARHVSGGMRARVPMVDILKAYVQEKFGGPVQRAVARMIPQIEEGASLAEAMDGEHAVFPLLFRRLVYVGEQGHALAGCMDTVADSYQVALENFRHVRRAVAYPLTIISLMLVIISGVHYFILPQFLSIFAELGAELPVVTQSMLGWQPTVLELLLLIPIVVLGGAFLGVHVRGYGVSRFLYLIPFFGPSLRLADTARFARILGLLTANKIPMPEALGLLAVSSPNAYSERALLNFKERYEQGEKLQDLIATQPLFPPGMAIMIAAAEDQGGLSETLRHLGDHYARRSEGDFALMREAFEPIMLIVGCAIVGLSIVALYMPLFNLPNVIR